MGGARLGLASLPLPDEVQASEQQVAEEQVRQRTLQKLAEVGIDPEGMSAGKILQVLYARGLGSSYKMMNVEAEKKLTFRAVTPQPMKTVFKPQALLELKGARDTPASFVHQHIDKWEMETLAEVCRSIKHFDEVDAGLKSEYTYAYSKRNYAGQYNRKKYIRPPTR